MANKVAQDLNGQRAGATYSGPAALLPFYLVHGYVYDDTSTTDKSKNTDTTPANDPTLAVNREDPGDPFAFGTDAALAPYVREITPKTGVAAGGTALVIEGDNFTGVTAVTVGGVATTAFSVVSDSEIHCTTGPHAAGAVNVFLDKGSTDTTVTNGFTYTA
jgi:hypothetical protein